MFSVAETAELTYLIPTPAEAGLGTDWTEPGFNDGFVAYLNGQLVAESNAPASPGWNAVATADREVQESLEYEAFDLTPHLGLLQSGTNVLAIHGLNYTADDPDFLILPELIREGYRFFGNPTPGAANTPGVVGFVEDTKFDVDRGFFVAPFYSEDSHDVI